MKRLLSFLLALLLLAAPLSLTALAEGQPPETPTQEQIVSGLTAEIAEAIRRADARAAAEAAAAAASAAVAAAAEAAAGAEAEAVPEAEDPAPSPAEEEVPAVSVQEEAPVEEDTPAADPVTAQEQDFYVLDLAGILTAPEREELSRAAREVSDTYGCSVHIGTLSDMRDYGFTNIEECSEVFFDSFGLGLGEERTGILLLLSMAERDYDIDAHGSFAHYAFTDYGKTVVSDVFLDDFRQNDWFGGFSDYIQRCGKLLSLAQDGKPVDVGSPLPSPARTAASIGMSLLLALIAALVICLLLKGKHTSVRAAVGAGQYVPAGAVEFRVREDHFVNRTVKRVKIERNRSSGGGGTSISSGGHSHSSGKF